MVYIVSKCLWLCLLVTATTCGSPYYQHHYHHDYSEYDYHDYKQTPIPRSYYPGTHVERSLRNDGGRNENFHPRDCEHKAVDTERENLGGTQRERSNNFDTREHQGRTNIESSDVYGREIHESGVIRERSDYIDTRQNQGGIKIERSDVEIRGKHEGGVKRERSDDGQARENHGSGVIRERSDDAGRNFESKVQNAQENEQRRSEKRAPDVVNRSMNGTLKIMNRPLPTINKRGGPDEAKVRFDDGLIFPDMINTRSGVEDTLSEELRSCMQMGICNTAPNFPSANISNLIKKLVDEGHDKFVVDELEPPKVTQRISDTDDIALCEEIEQLFIPKYAQDKDDKWHYILNTDDRPVQQIRVGICKNRNKECSNSLSYPIGYTSVCEQRHVLRKLVAMGQGNTHFETSFKIPSCCSCVLKAT